MMKLERRHLQSIVRRALTRWLQAGLLSMVLAGGFGCATSTGRSHGKVHFPDGRSAPVNHYTSSLPPDHEIQVDSLLILPPVGRIPEALSFSMHRALQERVDRVLPGTVLKRDSNDPVFSMLSRQRMVQRNGCLDLDAVAGIGRLADVSHVLAIRLVDPPTRRRQAPAMEWVLVATQTGEHVVMALGSGG